MAYNYGNYNGNWGNQYMQAPQNYSQSYPNQMNQMPAQQQVYNQGMNQMPMQTYSQPRPKSGINWVQGRAGANSFYVEPGESALLMDSEESVLYVKTVDATGRPLPLEVYDLVKRDSVVDMPQIAQRNQTGNAITMNPGPDMSEYVKKSDVEKMIADAVNKALNE